MSALESGYCSVEEYDRGKQFMVSPERLCIEGIYTFACKACPNLGWKACLFVARVSGIAEPENSGEPHVVSVNFEETDRQSTYQETTKYSMNSGGIIDLQPPFAEAYIRHHLDGTEDKFKSVMARTPMIMTEVPPVFAASY